MTARLAYEIHCNGKDDTCDRLFIDGDDRVRATRIKAKLEGWVHVIELKARDNPQKGGPIQSRSLDFCPDCAKTESRCHSLTATTFVVDPAADGAATDAPARRSR